MFRFFRGRGTPEDLAVSIVAVRLGDRLLQLGCDRYRLLAALGAKVGLTGRACAVDDRAAAAERARKAAAAAGVLVEIEAGSITQLPYPSESFDIVLVCDPGRLRPEVRVGCLQEAYRVLRPAGRCVVVEQAPRGGLGSLIGRRSSDAAYQAHGGAPPALRAEGFVAVRSLAKRSGVAYYEAARPRTS